MAACHSHAQESPYIVLLLLLLTHGPYFSMRSAGRVYLWLHHYALLIAPGAQPHPHKTRPIKPTTTTSSHDLELNSTPRPIKPTTTTSSHDVELNSTQRPQVAIPFLMRYASEVHSVGVQRDAMMGRQRLVVAALHPMAGLCNRITHVLSALAFAIATGRTLLFDWDAVPLQRRVNQMENASHSAFEDLFLKPPIQYSYREALARWGITHEQAMMEGGLRVDYDNERFLENLRFGDLDSLYPQSTIFIERYDWWGAPLVHNPLYAQAAFEGLSSSALFAALFRFLFAPLEPQVPSTECDWLLQYRSIWERTTAPIESFLQCAREHGLQQRVHVITDQPALQHMMPAVAHMQLAPTGCRAGLECDRLAIRTMYAHAGCKHAVLTATSTFGTCIAGLGEIADTYQVKADGSCHRRHTIDPIDAGTLDHQKPQITSVLALPPTLAQPRLAFVYLLMRLADKQAFLLSLRDLHSFFNDRHHYPVVLFVQDPQEWQDVQFLTSVRVHLVKVAPEQWAVPSHVRGYPEIFRLRSVPEHAGFDVQYRQMSRYAAGFLLSHPALARFEYVIKLDADLHAYAPWTEDPLMQMHQRKAKVGFWISYSDTEDVVDGLWACFALYVRTHGLQLRQPGLVLDSDGRYRRTNLYGCFMGAQTEEFRSERYQAFFRHFDATGGFFMHRWDEQKIMALYAALFLGEDEVESFSYISVKHQVMGTVPQKLAIAQVGAEALNRALYEQA